MQSLLISLLLVCFGPNFSAIDVNENIEQQQHNEVLTTASDFEPLQIVMEFETEKKGKRIAKESGEYAMVFGGARYAMITGTEGQNVQLIIDIEAKTMTTTTTNKDGEIVAVKMPLIRMGKGMFDNLNHTVTQTEEVRTILGYDCRKYIIMNEGDVTESWIANVPGLAWGELAKALIGGKKSNTTDLMTPIKDMPDAFALESHTTLKGGKKVVHSYVRSLAMGADADLSGLEIPEGAEVQDLTSLMKF